MIGANRAIPLPPPGMTNTLRQTDQVLQATYRWCRRCARRFFSSWIPPPHLKKIQPRRSLFDEKAKNATGGEHWLQFETLNSKRTMGFAAVKCSACNTRPVAERERLVYKSLRTKCFAHVSVFYGKTTTLQSIYKSVLVYMAPQIQAAQLIQCWLSICPRFASRVCSCFVFLDAGTTATQDTFTEQKLQLAFLANAGPTNPE